MFYTIFLTNFIALKITLTVHNNKIILNQSLLYLYISTTIIINIYISS
jgi:hypothetical protein